MGLPVVVAPSEAERLCAQLATTGHADCAATEDFDALAFGAPRLLRNLHHGTAAPQLPLVQARGPFDMRRALLGEEIRLKEILEQMQFSHLEFATRSQAEAFSASTRWISASWRAATTCPPSPRLVGPPGEAI